MVEKKSKPLFDTNEESVASDTNIALNEQQNRQGVDKDLRKDFDFIKVPV